MTEGSFEETRRRVFREHKNVIVKSALNGYKKKGRGLVFLKLTDGGGMEHISYWTLERLMNRQINARLIDQDFREKLISKISKYSPSSEVLVMVTDGEFGRFLVGSRRATQ